jgi:hypothetical protein
MAAVLKLCYFLHSLGTRTSHLFLCRLSKMVGLGGLEDYMLDSRIDPVCFVPHAWWLKWRDPTGQSRTRLGCWRTGSIGISVSTCCQDHPRPGTTWEQVFKSGVLHFTLGFLLLGTLLKFIPSAEFSHFFSMS